MEKEIIIKQASIEEAVEVDRKIPEFNKNYFLEKKFKKKLEGKDALILVAYSKNEPVGYIVLYDKGEKNLYAWMGGVLPNYRKKGAWKGLMKEAEKIALEKGYKRISAKSKNKFKPMLIYLLKNGYSIVDFSKATKDKENEIFFEKILSKFI